MKKAQESAYDIAFNPGVKSTVTKMTPVKKPSVAKAMEMVTGPLAAAGAAIGSTLESPTGKRMLQRAFLSNPMTAMGTPSGRQVLNKMYPVSQEELDVENHKTRVAAREGYKGGVAAAPWVTHQLAASAAKTVRQMIPSEAWHDFVDRNAAQLYRDANRAEAEYIDHLLGQTGKDWEGKDKFSDKLLQRRYNDLTDEEAAALSEWVVPANKRIRWGEYALDMAADWKLYGAMANGTGKLLRWGRAPWGNPVSRLSAAHPRIGRVMDYAVPVATFPLISDRKEELNDRDRRRRTK